MLMLADPLGSQTSVEVVLGPLEAVLAVNLACFECASLGWLLVGRAVFLAIVEIQVQDLV